MASLTATRRRVFLDSSVFFAASYSDRGSAHDLLLAAFNGAVVLVISDYVLNETERNILAGAPHVHAAFIRFRDVVPYELSNPPGSLIAETASLVAAKDAPIIAAARAAEVAVVVTYDRKHLLSQAATIEAQFGIIVVTPKQVLEEIA